MEELIASAEADYEKSFHRLIEKANIPERRETPLPKEETNREVSQCEKATLIKREKDTEHCNDSRDSEHSVLIQGLQGRLGQGFQSGPGSQGDCHANGCDCQSVSERAQNAAVRY